ncbi:MAG: hypothetical protein ABI977_19215 [Acidobacteriota bacterium]
MSENNNTENITAHEGAATAAAPALEAQPAPEAHHEEVSYHAVEKSGKITAIWEMKGRKHVRTIDPRSAEGRHLLGHTDNPEVVQSATV